MTDITGLDKVELLHALWVNTKPMCGKTWMPWDREMAILTVDRTPIGYFYGRYIKSDLMNDTVDTSAYNREHGEGAFERIVQQFRDM